MSTFLFDELIIGPISSRRLGSSLGINLLPKEQKICNFDCRYCECGTLLPTTPFHFCTALEVSTALEERLKQLATTNSLPDAITFAGNGEPTLHPNFIEIVEIVIQLRNTLSPQTKICVLTNATTLSNKKIVDVLQKVDLPMLKLDGGNIECINQLNQPTNPLYFDLLINQLK